MIIGDKNIPIGAMPGCFRLGWRHGLPEEVTTLSFFFLMQRNKFEDLRSEEEMRVTPHEQNITPSNYASFSKRWLTFKF